MKSANKQMYIAILLVSISFSNSYSSLSSNQPTKQLNPANSTQVKEKKEYCNEIDSRGNSVSMEAEENGRLPGYNTEDSYITDPANFNIREKVDPSHVPEPKMA